MPQIPLARRQQTSGASVRYKRQNTDGPTEEKFSTISEKTKPTVTMLLMEEQHAKEETAISAAMVDLAEDKHVVWSNKIDKQNLNISLECEWGDDS